MRLMQKANQLIFFSTMLQYRLLTAQTIGKLQPKIILVYGSARYKFFKDLQAQGIVVKSYQTARNRKKAPAGDVK